MSNIIAALSGDGRPLQCPTLRGIRTGQSPCSRDGVICCQACEWSARPNRNKRVMICLDRAIFKKKGGKSWNSDEEVFSTRISVCDRCFHNMY